MADVSAAPSPEACVRSRAPRRVLRWLGVLLLGSVALGILAQLGLPTLIRSQLERIGGEALGRVVRVDEVELALWDLAVTLRGVQIAGADASLPPLLTIDTLHADLDARSLLRFTPVLEALRIERPRVHVARLAEGRWDIDDILARLAARPKAPPDAEAPRFALYNVQLHGGELDLDDRVAGKHHPARDIRLELPFLSNQDVDLQVKVKPHLALKLAGAALELQGETLPFAPDRASELVIRLVGVDLARAWAYLPADLTWRPSGGVLSTALSLRFAQPPKQPARVQLAGTVEIEQFQLSHSSAAANEPTFTWRRLELQLGDVQPLARRVALAGVKLDGANLDLLRRADGTLALAGAPPASARPSAAPASAPSSGDAGWTVRVQRSELSGAHIRWRDAATRPATELHLQGLDAQAGEWQWPLEQPVTLQASAEFVAGTDRLGRLDLQGDVASERASLGVSIDALKLAAMEPYLAPLLVPKLSGQASLKGRVQWRGGANASVTIERAALDRLRLHEPGVKEPVVDIAALRLAALEVDLAKRSVTLGRIQLEKPLLRLARAADGRLNVQAWSPPPAATAPARGDDPNRPKDAQAPWRTEVVELKLEGGDVSWRDESVRNPDGEAHRLRATGLRIAASGLRWPSSAPSPATLQLATRLQTNGNDAGSLEWAGSAAVAPLALRGRLTLERVSALAATPYLVLPLRVAGGELGWRGDLSVTQESAGWRVDARGAALVSGLDLHARRSGAETQLLAWQSLRAEPLVATLAPGSKARVEIGELRLEDFFARLVVTEQGRFNLSDLQGEPPAATTLANAPPATPPAAPPAAAPAPTTPPGGGLPLELTIGGLQLSRGRVDFSDRFIRPNYSAALSELQGRVGRFSSSSREMAPVELTGRVAGTGLLDIRGSLNPTADPLALDLRARATDLELAPLSPYSGKYAGYAIERGKLSVDLAYRIDPDGQLSATNQITLNQLTFGAKTDSPDATKLPLRFALSLLADRDGVIDINLPVSGSINDPQFSVFGLVLRLIGNLLLKAVTSPFSLLTGSAGSGDETSHLAFEPGTTRLTAEGSATLERVAKALAERPALRLTVAGFAAAAEVEARRDELLRRTLRDGQADGSLPAPGSAAHTALLTRLYARTPLPDKPRNLLGMVRELPPAEMTTRLRAALPLAAPGADPWRDLALERGLAVRDELIARGLPSERIFLGEPNAAEGAPPGGAAVKLSLGGP